MNHKKTYPLFNPVKPPRALSEGLEEADRLLSNQRPFEALQQLQTMNQKYPQNRKILESMAFAYIDLENHYGYLDTMLQLDHLDSNNERVKLGLAEAYLKNGFTALALQTYRIIFNRWTKSENAKNIQKIIQQLELFAIETANKVDFSLEPGLDFFAQHEKLQILMNQEKFKRCKQIAGELLLQRPDFSPVRNNLSQISWLEGNLAEAIEITQKVLSFKPDNVHALSSLCSYYFMLGKKENASSVAKRLIESRILATEHWLTKIRALGFMGDDEGVIKILEMAKLDRNFKFIDGTFWHWCAVAEYRRGNTTKARAYWNKCLKLAPYFTLAGDNLEEMKKPFFDRICPQAYNIDPWLPRKIIKDFSAIVDHLSNPKDINSTKIKLGSYLDEHPEILQFIPAAITSGDNFTREFAFRLADMIADPKTLNWLKTFALGREGSDSLRMKAAQILTRYGVFKTGKKVKIWSRGDLIPVLMLGFVIVFESKEKTTLKPAVHKLMGDAIEAIQNRDGQVAENLMRRALEIQPDEPSLLNNLAVSLNMQGKVSEAEALADQIEKQFPEYFFGQLIAARKAISVNNIKKAQLILDKLMQKDELHITEFSALCSCQIDLNIAEKNLESAFSWLQTWEIVYPEDPSIKKYRELRIFTKAYSKLKDGNKNKPGLNKKPN